MVVETARADGIPDDWIKAAQESPIWKMAMEWKVAFPLHPEYRTLPMVWYIPPLSPIQNAAEAGSIGVDGEMPDVRSLRIPVKYLANLLTAGDEEPVVHALERMLAMRAYMRYYGRGRYTSLVRACQRERIIVKNAHRAIGDCRMTLALVQKMAATAETA